MATKKQQSISNFFSKPKNDVPQRGNSAEDFELPLPKRRKVSIEPTGTESDAEEVNDPGAATSQLKPLSPNRQNSRSLLAKDSTVHRTSKYLFSSSTAHDEENDGTSQQDQARKDELHRKFVKKLGKPDSINDIKRRNKAFSEEDNAEDGEDEDDAPTEPIQSLPKGRMSSKKSSKLTPMEKQIIDIKQAHMDTLLVVEVGYKFRFFGEDARTASKELGIVCIPGKFRFDEHPSEAHLDKFASASIPVHRLHVHVKRLVTAGHKVGVVRQLETAALKAVGDNRNTPFVRKLTNLYTKGTYIDDAEGLEEDQAQAGSKSSSTGFLLCMTEDNAKGYGNDDKIHVGIVAVQPATGDVIYDNFDDGFMRSEIETRLLHIAPCEFLIVGDLSKATEKLVLHLSGSKANVFGDRARVEHVAKHKTFTAEAHDHVSSFYDKQLKASSTDSERSARIMEKILGLPEHVMVCLSALIKHLSEYGLENVFDLTKYFHPFSARSHMLLNGNTLNSLEIYQNQTDHTSRGSLFWMLDRTRTRFGARLLRKWVGRPLLDKAAIDARLEAIEELNDPEKAVVVEKLNVVLRRVKTDLEKSLLRIYYGKCTRPELLGVLQTFQFLAQEYTHATTASSTGFNSELLSSAVMKLPTIHGEITEYLERINLSAAKKDDKYTFFQTEHEREEISDEKLSIAAVEHDLETFRAKAAETLGRKRPVDYVTVAGIDYLIEVENSSNTIRKVPASWAKISGTKKVSRFHPPEVVKFIRERDQHREALAAACDNAFQQLLVEVGYSYPHFRDAILALASLDCLVSLASVAAQPGYSRPRFVDGTSVEVSGARHPMIEQLLLDTYVPNDISLASDSTRALLVTGPNMGGKSSYVRSVALICIMAQIGSFVPADAATLGIVDAVFTRMGAFDNMMAGESTFMVELSETSDILKVATERSLVVLDELGRGTSTHDGVAIAGSVLDWLIREKKCLTLFITHYQVLARMADGFPDGELRNVHMKFSEDVQGGDNVTFLYEVGEGVAHRSYGLNVAHLAGLGTAVIDCAREKSSELEITMRTKQLLRMSTLLQSATTDVDVDSLVDAVEML